MVSNPAQSMALFVIDEVKTGFRVAVGYGHRSCMAFMLIHKLMRRRWGMVILWLVLEDGQRLWMWIYAGGGVVHGGTYTANLVALSAA